MSHTLASPNVKKPKERLELWPDQRMGVNALMRGWRMRKNSLVVIPTGGGKSLVCAETAHNIAPFDNVLVIVPTLDLVRQNLDALHTQYSDADVTVCCAGMGANNINGSIVIATPGSIVRKDLSRFSVILIDEAHRVPERSDAMLQKIIAGVRETTPDAPVLGLTATPFRMSGRLDNGDIWSGIDFEIGYLDMLRDKRLAPLVGPLNAEMFAMDVSGVKKTAGDYNEADLERKFSNDETSLTIAKDIARLGHNRKSWLVFGVSVNHTIRLRDALRLCGVSCEAVTGLTPIAERIEILEKFRAGKIRALVNCQILTTGFNAPAVDLLALCRPTMSPGLHVQMIGRGARTAPGKASCLVLDFAQNIARNGTIDKPIVRERGVREASPPEPKQCGECGYYNPPGARTCDNCGEEFPSDKPRSEAALSLEADREAAPVANIERAKLPANHYRVTGVTYSQHVKPGSRPSLRIEYHVAGYRYRSCSLWIAAWHLRNPWRARETWANLLRDDAPRLLPENAAEAVVAAPDLLRRPEFVTITDVDGFPRVTPIFGEIGK